MHDFVISIAVLFVLVDDTLLIIMTAVDSTPQKYTRTATLHETDTQD